MHLREAYVPSVRGTDTGKGKELSKDHQTLLLTGDLTIKASTQTKQRVEEALAGAAVGRTTLLVDITDEHDADLTLAQLLLSAKRTAERAQIAFRLQRPAVGSLLAVLTRGGLIGVGSPDNEFWLHEGVTQ
jgi:ABC-type transporter Mla MlaB component